MQRRNNQNMCGCLRIKIVKGKDIFIAINNLSRNLSFNNFAEYAIWIKCHECDYTFTKFSRLRLSLITQPFRHGPNEIWGDQVAQLAPQLY